MNGGRRSDDACRHAGLGPWCRLVLTLAVVVAPVVGLPAAGRAEPPAAEEWRSTVIADDLRGPLRLAVSPPGQTLFVLRGTEGDVLAVDLDDTTRRWTAIAPRGGAVPLAIGAVDSGTLALVVREGDAFSIRVHKLPAPGMPPDESEIQTVPLGVTGGKTDEVRVVVSPARDWLAVVGLPEPLPRVARATINGARLGGISERRCPRTSQRPAAVTAGPNAEWILFGPGDDGAARPAFLSWFSPSGAQRLLTLDTGLEGVVDAANCRETGLLWALATGGVAAGGARTGLWRVDAALVGGRQAVRAIPVAPLPQPTALVCLPKGEVAVAHGTAPARVLRFAPPGTSDRPVKNEGESP